jgi:membrane-bound metal-dependent hydrolase YbcI (DUF457 family)
MSRAIPSPDAVVRLLFFRETILPYPIGHSLVAWTIGVISRRQTLSMADLKTPIWWSLMAVSPDFDFAISAITGDYALHRSGTHSLITAVVIGMLLAVIECRSFNWKRGCLYSALIGSHCLLDWAVTKDGHTSGPALFWPITSERYGLGIGTLPAFSISVPVIWQPIVELAQVCLIETIIFLPIFLLVSLIVNHFRRSTSASAIG